MLRLKSAENRTKQMLRCLLGHSIGSRVRNFRLFKATKWSSHIFYRDAFTITRRIDFLDGRDTLPHNWPRWIPGSGDLFLRDLDVTSISHEYLLRVPELSSTCHEHMLYPGTPLRDEHWKCCGVSLLPKQHSVMPQPVSGEY